MGHYVLSSYNVRGCTAHGGVLIYCKPTQTTNKIETVDNLSREKHFEVTAMEMTSLNIIVECIYRAPRGNLTRNPQNSSTTKITKICLNNYITNHQIQVIPSVLSDHSEVVTIIIIDIFQSSS